MFVKVKTQAYGLTQMMRKQNVDTRYDVALPLSQIKKSYVDTLAIGNVLSLGLKELKLVLIYKNKKVANVSLETNRIKIIPLKAKDINKLHTKKYQYLKCSFLELDIKELKDGMGISIGSIDYDLLTLSVDDVTIAKGSLVNMGDEIAIKITELMT
jgi:hypothetical protein